MATGVLIDDQNANDFSEAGSYQGNVDKVFIECKFNHLSRGNFADTQKALEAFLSSQGVPRQSYVAELILFMERSFAGKYRNGERFHYQRIMPSKSWREGDSLAEKLTRCKDKETFKKRFDRIGNTGILKRGHFNKFEISNLDFAGKMYLRLIDTNRGNVSLFFRNDQLADAFVKSAIAFYREELKNEKYKIRGSLTGIAERGGGGNPEVVYLENPNPLLNTRFESENLSRKNKGTTLTLVHTSPNGTNNQNPPGKDRKGVEDSDADHDHQLIPEEYGLLSENKEIEPNFGGHKVITSEKSLSGLQIFKLWRSSVLAKHPELCISDIPTNKLLKIAMDFNKRFREFFPDEPITNLFDRLTEHWITVSKCLKENGVWQILGKYPELPNLLKQSNHVLSWYKSQISGPKEKKASGIAPSKMQPTHPVPFIGCINETAPGRTFVKGISESLEYLIARLENDEEFGELGQITIATNYEKLEKLSMDMAASIARIEALKALPRDEVDQYCC